MTISGFLPQRWRPTAEAARHADAIGGILHTAPLPATARGPAIASLLGTVDVLPYLVAVKSLVGTIGRGRPTIVDDGTLTGEDRAILAHHCNDPEILPHQAVPRGTFPPGGAWALLLTILDQRASQYWIALDPCSVTLGPVPEVEAAVASNRSFALPGNGAGGGPARRAERRMAALCGTRGWRYRPGCAGLTGFAAGSAGRALATAFVSELTAAGEEATPEAARNVVLANDVEPVILPKHRFQRFSATADGSLAAFLHFPRGFGDGDAFAAASREAVAKLPV